MSLSDAGSGLVRINRARKEIGIYRMLGMCGRRFKDVLDRVGLPGR